MQSSNDRTGFSVEKLQSIGLCAGHAYSVLDAVELPTKDKDKIIQLRNPWGSFEWKGAWSDTDPRWTAELRKGTHQGVDSSADHHDDADDGAFFMSVKDFTFYFGTVGVCDPFELARRDESGDGPVDTAIVSGIRLKNGAVATIECGLATEVMLTAYQKDIRCEAGAVTWKRATVSFRCAASEGEWANVVSFPRRTYTRTVSIGTKGIHVGSRAPVHSAPPSEEELLEDLLDGGGGGGHNALEELILKKETVGLIDGLDKLDLSQLKDAAVKAAR